MAAAVTPGSDTCPSAMMRRMVYCQSARTSSIVLRMMGIPNAGANEVHSEDELRILLSQSQTEGVMSFRRLLFAENVFDLGDLRARDAMRSR